MATTSTEITDSTNTSSNSTMQKHVESLSVQQIVNWDMVDITSTRMRVKAKFEDPGAISTTSAVSLI